jgi:hypothetical protein
MNYVSREKLIEVAREAIADGLSADSMTTLRNRVEEYGEQQKRVDDLNHWFRKLKKKDFDGTRADTEWLNNWLSELP